MSAARQLSLLDPEPAAPAPDVDEGAPRITEAEFDAFAAWRRAHPPAPSMASTEHSEWMAFSAARLLAEMRERAPDPASGGAPPATSTTMERDR